jgi:regulatory protein
VVCFRPDELMEFVPTESMEAKPDKILLKKAAALLAHRPYSRGELRSKLMAISTRISPEPVLDRLEQLNLLNDAEYAYNFALYRIQQEGWGPAKISTSLVRRHIAQSTIECALERIRSELGKEPTLMEYIEKHCAKQGLPTNPKDIRKLVSHLSRRGFEESHILGALKRVVPLALLQHFETGD